MVRRLQFKNHCGRRFVFLNVFIVPIRLADDIFGNCNNCFIVILFVLQLFILNT